MVIQRIGREAVLEQAVRDSLPEWYEEAIVRSGVSTVGDPRLDMNDLPSVGEALNFSIEVAVTPKASLGAYKDLEVGKRSPRCPTAPCRSSSTGCGSPSRGWRAWTAARSRATIS